MGELQKSKCIICAKPSNIQIYDHRVREYCSYECTELIDIGNCHVCGDPVNQRYIYKVGYDSPAGSKDSIYSTCGIEHYKQIDEIITCGSKKINS